MMRNKGPGRAACCLRKERTAGTPQRSDPAVISEPLKTKASQTHSERSQDDPGKQYNDPQTPGSEDPQSATERNMTYKAPTQNKACQGSENRLFPEPGTDSRQEIAQGQKDVIHREQKPS